MKKEDGRKNIVVYDSGDDSLTLINRKRNADHTINAGFALISVNKERQIVGIELMGVNKNFEIPKKVLRNIVSAEVKVRYKEIHKMLVMTITLYSDHKSSQLLLSANEFKENIHGTNLKATA